MLNSKKHILKIGLIIAYLIGGQAFLSAAFQTNNSVEIEMNVLPGLQFNLPRFHVKPGQQVKIVFTNTDDMDHNLLILNPGTREKIVKKAMEMGDALKKLYFSFGNS